MVALLGSTLFWPTPRFDWRGKLPARYREIAFHPCGQIEAAFWGGPVSHEWSFASPFTMEHTLRDLQAAFPAAKFVRVGGDDQLTLDGSGSPSLSIQRGYGSSVNVGALSESKPPQPFSWCLARIVPRDTLERLGWIKSPTRS